MSRWVCAREALCGMAHPDAKDWWRVSTRLAFGVLFGRAFLAMRHATPVPISIDWAAAQTYQDNAPPGNLGRALWLHQFPRQTSAGTAFRQAQACRPASWLRCRVKHLRVLLPREWGGCCRQLLMRAVHVSKHAIAFKHEKSVNMKNQDRFILFYFHVCMNIY